MKQYLEKLLAGLATPYSQASEVRPLSAITGQVWGMDAQASYTSGKLSLTENLFPGSGVAAAADWATEQNFVAASPSPNQAYSYFHLASAWAARRSTPGQADSSLFDANRLKAAQHICDQHSPNGYLYYKGAVAGIQKYIYNNIKAEQIGEAEKVGKRLRGRSFLVALLGDLVAEYLVEAMQLAQANILFVGGGHFNLLLPNTPAVRTQMETLLWEINDKLLNQFNLQLSIYAAAEQIQANDFTDFGHCFEAVHAKLEALKLRRFEQHLDEVFFKKRRVPNRNLDKDEEARGQIYAKTKEEKQLENLGRLIPEARFLLTVSGDYLLRRDFRKTIGCKSYFDLQALGQDILLLSGTNLASAWEELIAGLEKNADFSGLRLKLHTLNDTNFLPPDSLQARFQELPISYGFRMVGQFAPTYENLGFDTQEEGLVELSDLASVGPNPKEPLGYKQLAALRLDIDDLGALFAQGLGKKAHLSRTLALSRELQLFFGGYFNKIAKARHCYVVYSGGDDAFVLGSWENVLFFLRDLREKFQQFTSNNPAIGFSAGIHLCHAKYPIARLADDAGEAEKKAKKFGAPPLAPEQAKKNAVNVFGHTLSWKRYEAMMDFAERLFKQTEHQGGHIKRSVLQVLLRTIQSAHKLKIAAKVKDDENDDAHFELYRNLGRLHGLLSRRNQFGKANKEENLLVDELLKEMSDFEAFDDYLIPLHYVLYKTRRS